MCVEEIKIRISVLREYDLRGEITDDELEELNQLIKILQSLENNNIK